LSESETNELLRELLRWTKVSSIPHVKSLLESTLRTAEQRLAYEHSVGITLLEVAKISGASKSSVANWWNSWTKLGIAEMKSVQGGTRAIRSFSLEDFGIDVQKSHHIEVTKVKRLMEEPE
jgi:hypothetical protein